MKSSTSDLEVCKKCGIEKSRAEFDKNGVGGLRGKCKACRSKDSKQYYQENRKREIERNKQNYQKNREKRLRRQREYYQENKEKWREYEKKRYEENPHSKIISQQKRRARKKRAAVDLTDNELLAIQLIYEDAHVLGYHVDHIVPLSKGGKHHPDNLQIVSPSYNLRKNDKVFNTRKYY